MPNDWDRHYIRHKSAQRRRGVLARWLVLHDKIAALVMHQVHSSGFTAGYTLHTYTVPLCYITDISIQYNFFIFACHRNF